MNDANRRDDAIALLRTYLESHPDDGDARVVLGSMQSWSGRYDDARATLKPLTDRDSPRMDAMRVRINVELWSDNNSEAERLASAAVQLEPEAVDLRVVHARALRALQRLPDASREVDEALKRAPDDKVALQLRETLLDEQRYWATTASYSHDWFSDGRAGWDEASLQLRRSTPVGSVFARLSYAHRFGLSDGQAELEFYPSFRPGTYGYVEVGYSPIHNFYPQFRWSADLYQSLGAGFEASIGWRQLWFSEPVNLGVITLGKYWGDWFFYVKGFIVLPTAKDFSVSGSGHAGARWYFNDATAYVGLRYGRGVAPEATNALLTGAFDVNVLSSDVLAAEYEQALPASWVIGARASLSRQQRTVLSDLWQGEVSANLTYRF